MARYKRKSKVEPELETSLEDIEVPEEPSKDFAVMYFKKLYREHEGVPCLNADQFGYISENCCNVLECSMKQFLDRLPFMFDIYYNCGYKRPGYSLVPACFKQEWMLFNLYYGVTYSAKFGIDYRWTFEETKLVQAYCSNLREIFGIKFELNYENIKECCVHFCKERKIDYAKFPEVIKDCMLKYKENNCKSQFRCSYLSPNMITNSYIMDIVMGSNNNSNKGGFNCSGPSMNKELVERMAKDGYSPDQFEEWSAYQDSLGDTDIII